MLLTRASSQCYDSLLSLMYPRACGWCGNSVESRALGVACEECWESTHIFSESEVCCWKCGLLSPAAVPIEKREQIRCRRCDTDAFTVARACGIYEKALRASVLSLKHESNVSPKVSELLISAQRRYPLNLATRLVPVPLHREREKARGFNQAVVIANELSRVSRLPVDDSSVIRTLHSVRHRAGMDARGRRETVAGAFVVTRPTVIRGERILLVDDVFTTGATVSSCAASLIEAGAAEVYVLTIARAIR